MLYKTIRMVTFDVTDTLLRFRCSPGQQYAAAAARHGVALDGEVMAPIFLHNYKALCTQYPNFGKTANIHWEEWWRRVVKKTFKSHVSETEVLEKITSYLIESYKTKEFWIVNDGCENILKYLKEKGVVLGVISNFDPRLNDILANMGLRGYFDFVLTSYEAGFTKPNKEIFLKALARGGMAGQEPSGALHVGDNERLDYQGARQAGWQAVRLSPVLRASAWPGDAECFPQSSQAEDTFRGLPDLHKHLSVNQAIFDE